MDKKKFLIFLFSLLFLLVALSCSMKEVDNYLGKRYELYKVDGYYVSSVYKTTNFHVTFYEDKAVLEVNCPEKHIATINSEYIKYSDDKNIVSFKFVLNYYGDSIEVVNGKVKYYSDKPDYLGIYASEIITVDRYNQKESISGLIEFRR